MREPALHLYVHVEGPVHLPHQQQFASSDITGIVSISKGCTHLQSSAVATLHCWHALLAWTCAQSNRE